MALQEFVKGALDNAVTKPGYPGLPEGRAPLITLLKQMAYLKRLRKDQRFQASHTSHSMDLQKTVVRYEAM